MELGKILRQVANGVGKIFEETPEMARERIRKERKEEREKKLHNYITGDDLRKGNELVRPVSLSPRNRSGVVDVTTQSGTNIFANGFENTRVAVEESTEPGGNIRTRIIIEATRSE